MKKDFLFSLLLHASVVAACLLSTLIPTHRVEEAEQTLPVEIVNIGDLTQTNKKTAPIIAPEPSPPPKEEKKPEPPKDIPLEKEQNNQPPTPVADAPRPEEAKERTPQPEPKPEEEPVEHQEEEEPETQEEEPDEEPDPVPEPKPEPKPEPEPKVEKPLSLPKKKPTPPKPVEKPDEKVKEKKRQKQFDGMLKNLIKSSHTKNPQEDKESDRETGQEDSPLPEGDELSATEMAILRQHVSKFWNVDKGVKNAQGLSVTIRLTIGKDRHLQKAEIVDKDAYRSDPTFRSAADRALRAVHDPGFSPVPLPPEKHHLWKQFLYIFDPKDM